MRLGFDKQIKVEGECIIVIPTSNDDTNLLNDVQVPSLAHNFLSVVQLIKGAYSILFKNDAVVLTMKNPDTKLQKSI